MASPTSTTAPDVERYPTGGGRTIYRLPLEVFPGFWGNAYLIDGGRAPVLVDCGSGQPCSNAAFDRAGERLAACFPAAPRLADVGTVVLTHGHIDHFGGLPRVRRETAAPVAIHVLDRRVLTGFRERLVLTGRRLASFLTGAGVPAARRERMLTAWLGTKRLFDAHPVDSTFDARCFAPADLLEGELRAHHAPGHCPGQVMLEVDDVLLTADHLLARISPHLSPEEITLGNGVGHYFDSLDAVHRIAGVRLGLGGHFGPIEDVYARAEEIRALHRRRHEEILTSCRTPRTVDDLSREIFGRQQSYHVLLALLEAGAHVEYLHQRGALAVDNVEELERADAAVRWRTA